MSQSTPNNNVDLGMQAAIAQKQLAQQQQQWAANQAIENQANNVAQQQVMQDTNTETANNLAQQQQYAAQNQAQGMAANSTGGPAGIKAAATLQNNTAGLSPADLKLQAAGIAAAPTSLASLMQKRAAGTSTTPGSSSLFNSSNVKLGGS